MLPILAGHVSMVVTLLDQAFQDLELLHAYTQIVSDEVPCSCESLCLAVLCNDVYKVNRQVVKSLHQAIGYAMLDNKPSYDSISKMIRYTLNQLHLLPYDHVTRF